MKFDIYIGDETNRFVLGKAGKNPLVIFGINPSTANECKSDQTISKIEKLISAWKYDGFLMFNLYPARASKPESLPKICDAGLAKQNTDAIRDGLKKSNSRTIWAAWGDAFDRRTYFKNCLEKILPITKDLIWKKCESLTESENPRHPLSGQPHIITERSRLIDFDVENYLRAVKKFNPHETI